MRVTFFALVTIFFASCTNSITSDSKSTGSKLRTTMDFITYFNGIDNMLNYKKVKDSVETVGAELKRSTTLSEDKKAILKAYYNDVQSKSETMYNQIVADLLSKEKRREIKDNVSGYIQSLNVQFDAIRASGVAFTDKAKELEGVGRGFFVGWLIKTFLLPIAKEFVEEIIGTAVRQTLDNNLKPKLVIKKWDNL